MPKRRKKSCPPIILYEKLRYSFRFRLFAAFVLIIILFIPTTGYLAYLQGKKAVKLRIRQHSISMVAQIAERVHSFLSQPVYNVRLLKIFLENQIIDPLDRQTMITYFHLIRGEYPEFLNLNIGYEDGRFIMVPPQRPAIHKLFYPRVRPWYTGAIRQDGLYQTNVYMFASSQHPGITISMPYKNRAGITQGVCAIDIDLSTLSRFLQTLKIGRHGQAYIFDKKHGRIIADPNLLRLRYDPEKIKFQIASARDLVVEGRQFGESVYQGTRYFTVQTDYVQNNWTIGITVPVADFMNDIRYIQKTTILSVLTAIVLAIALSGLLFHTVTKPLKKLEKGIRKVSDGDLEYNLNLDNPAIVGSVATAFNQMALSLKQSRAELEKTYLELAAKEKMAALGALTAGIAHEIKNPLGIILGSAQIAANESKPPAMRKKAACFIIDEIARLDRTLKSFLAFARPAVPQLVPTDIRPLLEDAFAFIENEAKNQGITIECDFKTGDALCLADADLLRQALLNILFNAVQAMPDGGVLTIRASLFKGKNKEDGGVSKTFINILIADTGCGILPEHMDKIFEPFVTFKDDGTGLGLSIVVQILRQQGATIAVDSKVGQGTTFTILLPCCSADKQG